MINAITTSRRGNSLLQAILWAGFICGSLDITFACIDAYTRSGATPERVLRYVASGLLGKEAFQGSGWFAIAGLLIHYAIAYTFTIFFFLVYPAIKVLWINRAITGIMYGIFVWLVMNLAVVPFTRVPKGTFHLDRALLGGFILIIAIGLPLSFLAHKYYATKNINEVLET